MTMPTDTSAAPVALPDWDTLRVGDALPPLQLPPITRLALALYCGASGDHNPIHVDRDFAQAAGLPDVFAHGMLSAAWLAQVLTAWAPQHALRTLDLRFAAITHVGDCIVCTGHVTHKLEDGGRSARVALQAADANGSVTLSAVALIAWPQSTTNHTPRRSAT